MLFCFSNVESPYVLITIEAKKEREREYFKPNLTPVSSIVGLFSAMRALVLLLVKCGMLNG